MECSSFVSYKAVRAGAAGAARAAPLTIILPTMAPHILWASDGTELSVNTT